MLLLVIFGSMGAGIGFPAVGKIFSPYPFYLLMILLFFSFLKIEFSEVIHHAGETASMLLILCLCKLLIVPVVLFFIAQALLPEYALPILLMSGISTGVLAPFISGLLNASTLLALMMVVITSLSAPFSLPALVKLLLGETIEISFLSMVRVLIMVIFVPAFFAALLREWAPSFPKKLETLQFPVSLVICACVNLGVFPKYSSYFTERPAELVGAIVVAFVLSAILHVLGFFVTLSKRKEDRLAGAVSFACMNNVLIIVFSSQFFGPLAPTLAAVYILPFFSMIVPARIAGKLIR
jgi:BASS family bile acid:Na+ symporter